MIMSYPGSSMAGAGRAAAAFAALFPAGATTPIELGGMTAVLRSICPGEVTARMTVTRKLTLADPEMELDDGQREALEAGPQEPAYRREGYLIDAFTGQPAAWTSAVVLLSRVPWHCREPLGLSRAGNPVQGRPTMPLGTALSHRGIYREQTATILTPGLTGPGGLRQALYSEAVLRGIRPVALVTERVFGSFLDAYPPPWPAVPSAGSRQDPGRAGAA
jgi:hypothetical protein